MIRLLKASILMVLLGHACAMDSTNSMLAADGECHASKDSVSYQCHLGFVQKQAVRHIQKRTRPEASESTCTIWGDPKISVFDKAEKTWGGYFSSFFSEKSDDKIDANEEGDFWLVKSSDVQIQGRYNIDKANHGNGTDGCNGTNPYLRAIAVGGPFLRGNTLVIGTGSKSIFWNDDEVLTFPGSELRAVDLVKARSSGSVPLVEDPEKTSPGITAELAKGVKLVVNRHEHGLGLAITMSKLEDGQDGQCGNFNGDHEDDTAEMISGRLGLQVPADQLLFKHVFEPTEKKSLRHAKSAHEHGQLDSTGALVHKKGKQESTEALAVIHYGENSFVRHKGTCDAQTQTVVAVPSNVGTCSDCAKLCSEYDGCIGFDTDCNSCYLKKACSQETGGAGECTGMCGYMKDDSPRHASSKRKVESQLASTEASCTIYGDPHIVGFDKAPNHLSFMEVGAVTDAGGDGFTVGDTWLVKSSLVHIQGRFNIAKQADKHHRTFLTVLAVGGPFLENNTLTVGAEGAKIFWNDEEILTSMPSIFENNVVSARYHADSVLVHDAARTAPGVDVDLPLGVMLTVNRGKNGLGVKITMPKLEGGQDGQCGNFNHDASDDTTDNIAKEISSAELLFRDGIDM